MKDFQDKKIIIIGSAHPLRGGGIATFNERLAEVLQDSGAEVIIYSFSLQYPNLLFPGKNQFTDEPPPDNLLIKSSINSINPFNWLASAKAIREENADIIIVRYWIPFIALSLGSILRLIKRKSTPRIIAILDNLIPHEKRIGDHALTKYFLKPIDGFVTMSKEVLKDLAIFNNTRPVVYSPHPLYDNYGEKLEKIEALKKLGLNPNKNYILFFGFIRHYKGLDLLLEAMSEPVLRQLDVHLIIAGEFYDDEAPYKRQIQDGNIGDKVHLFDNFIPNDHIKYFFSAVDLVVQPYRSATQSGISQVAYHFKVPMIVTDVGGLAEIVPDGKVGYVVQPEPLAIAHAIAQFFEQCKSEEFIAGLKNEKQKFEWRYFLQNIVQLYLDIAKK